MREWRKAARFLLPVSHASYHRLHPQKAQHLPESIVPWPQCFMADLGLKAFDGFGCDAGCFQL